MMDFLFQCNICLHLVCSEIATNAECTDIVCDQWLRFSVKDPDMGERMVHEAAKIRKTWDTLIEDILQHKVVNLVQKSELSVI